MEQKSETVKIRDQFGSKIGFILAATGSAVGLGNIWKFPYMAGENGGGAFVFIYLASVIVIGVSLVLAEFALGRNTQLAAVGAFRKLDKRFTFIGSMGVLSAFLIMGFYPVVGGWSLSYVAKTLLGELTITNPDELAGIFGGLISGTFSPIFWTGIYLVLNVVIVAGGIGGGIEKASKILMPALFILLIILVVRSVTLPGAGEGLTFLFKPDFSQINGQIILAAMGQAFFSLSLGMGCLITYSSYLGKKENIVQTATIVPFLDTLVALLAGVAILPAVFALGFEPTDGPGLVFIILPGVFATMGAVGKIFGVLFFVFISVAALTSSISLLEVIVAYLIDEKDWTRKKALSIVSVILFIMGITASLSMGPWAEFTIGGKNIFDIYDFIASNVLLPLGGMFICIFIGWFWGRKNASKEITNDGTIKFSLFNTWFFLCKWVIPVIIFLVFLSGIGIINI